MCGQGNDGNAAFSAFDVTNLRRRFSTRHTRHLNVHEYQVNAFAYAAFIFGIWRVLLALFGFGLCRLVLKALRLVAFIFLHVRFTDHFNRFKAAIGGNDFNTKLA